MPAFARRRPGLAAAVLLILASGCGPGPATVEGTVTLDGAAVLSGQIVFVPIEGTSGGGARAQVVAGRYAVRDDSRLAPGTYRVEVYAPKKTGVKVPAGSPAPPGTMVDQEVESIPAGYNRSSVLRQVLKAGTNSCDFPLRGKGP